MDISKEQLDALRYSPFHGLVYVKNQKAGCTSIEYSLWTDKDKKTGRRTFRGKTHHHRSPLVGGAEGLLASDRERLRQADVFTVVRNPFSRILSAYLHHVFDETLTSRLTRRLGLWRSTDIRHRYYRAIGVNPKHSLDFETFLEHLAQTPPERLTGHFRPQVANVLWGQLDYGFVGRLEEPETLADFFAAHGIDFKKRSPHSQGAADKLARYYSPRAVELVAEYFAQDFETFGYDAGEPASTRLQPLPATSGRQTLLELLDRLSVA